MLWKACYIFFSLNTYDSSFKLVLLHCIFVENEEIEVQMKFTQLISTDLFLLSCHTIQIVVSYENKHQYVTFYIKYNEHISVL